MRLRESSKFWDIFLVALGVSIGASGLFFVYFDFSLGLKKDLNEVDKIKEFARISQKQNTVKRKPFDMPIWSELGEAEILYESDKIFTEKDAKATIQFKDGTAINIGGNSLLVLQKKDNLAEIDLKKGTLFARVKSNNSNIQIKVGDVKTQIKSDNAQLQIKKKEDGSADVTVLEGKAETSVKGSVVEVEKNKRFEILTDGSITQPKILAFQLETPEREEKIYLDEGIPVIFRWKAVEDIKEVEIELSKEADFKKLYKKQKISENQLALNGLSAGTYYWRIGSYNASIKAKEYSEERTVTIFENKPVKLLSPAKGSFLEFQEVLAQGKDVKQDVKPDVNQEINGIKVFMFWEEVQEIDNYWVEISNQPDFTKVLKKENVKKAAYEIFLPEGKYYWKVGFVSSLRKTEKISSAFDFEIKKISLPGAPVNLKPEVEHIAEIYTEFPVINLNWEKVGSAKTYILEMASSDKFVNDEKTGVVVTKKEIETNIFPLKVESFANDIYWRVRVKDPFGRETQVSPAHKITFKFSSPEILLPKESVNIRLIPQPDPIDFSWQSSFLAQKYQIEISKDDQFKKIIHQVEVSEPKYQWKQSQEGGLYWRVRALFDGGKKSEYKSTQLKVISYAIPQPPVMDPVIDVEVSEEKD